MPTASIYKSSLILVYVISCILICIAQAIMAYRTQYFKYLWRHSCLSLRIHHGESCTKLSNCSDKIKMPKSTTGCPIKSFILIENLNVEELSATWSNLNNFSQVCLKRIQKSASLRCSLPPTVCFLFYNDFCKLLIITKDSLIGSWSIYNLIGKFLIY